jgi:hypothetical protein
VSSGEDAVVPLVTRRELLVAGLLVPLAAACTSDKAARPTPLPTDADSLARAAAAASEQLAADAYAAAMTAVPALNARLTPLREHHVAHVSALVHPASPSARPTPTTASPTAPGPGNPARVLAGLAAQERALQSQHTAALKQVSPELALLLASLAAAAAAHDAELRRR